MRYYTYYVQKMVWRTANQPDVMYFIGYRITDLLKTKVFFSIIMLTGL